MSKRLFSILAAAALVASVFTALPARAQAVTIPDPVQIDDPVGDANLLNDQDNAYDVGPPLQGEGDHVTPADVGTATDIMKVWFSNTADEISLNIQLEGNPANLAYDTYLRFSSNVGEGSVASDAVRGCLQWAASVNGAGGAYQGETEGTLTDKCNVGDAVVGPLAITEGPDATFVVTVTFPRSYSPLLADGQTLTAPFGVSRVLYVGPTPTTATAVTMDSTKRGTDYTIVSEGPILEPVAPPGKNDPPGKGVKKGCKKGKGLKKGACAGKKKKKNPAACPAYVPGEEGKDAPVAVVTDTATAEAPLELEFDAPAGAGDDLGQAGGAYDETASLYQNIQVDSTLPEVGLYVRYEFPERHDYDLYLNYADGSRAANSGDFNAGADVEHLGSGSPDGGWESGTNYESVIGIRTSDCGAYTAQLVSYLTTGGATTLKMWLGEVKADPAAPGGSESASETSSLDTFWGLMGQRDSSSARSMATPAANKGCKKGKGKKSGCKKPPVACAALTPSAEGTGKPTVVLTDAATAEAPVEQKIMLAESLADVDLVGAALEPSYDYFNVQVDSASASAGLYATFEFETRRDYDLYARWSDGSEAASSHGFNPAVEAEAPEPVPFDPSNQRSNHAGDTNADSENLVGLITSDCGGYTIEVVNWLGEGGDFTVKLWLGEGTTEPLAPGERPA